MGALIGVFGGPNKFSRRVDDAESHRSSLVLVAVEKLGIGSVMLHHVEFPDEVESVGKTGVETLAAVDRVDVTGIACQEDLVVHAVLGGHRFFDRELGEPDHFFEIQAMGLDRLLDSLQGLLVGEVVSVHADVEAVDVAFSWDPGNVRGLVLEDDDLGDFGEIGVQNSVDDGPNDLWADDGERDVEMVSDP